jgi:hypothetical protein
VTSSIHALASGEIIARACLVDTHCATWCSFIKGIDRALVPGFWAASIWVVFNILYLVVGLSGVGL